MDVFVGVLAFVGAITLMTLFISTITSLIGLYDKYGDYKKDGAIGGKLEDSRRRNGELKALLDARDKEIDELKRQGPSRGAT